MMIVPAIAGLVVAGCFTITGHYVDKAAVAGKTPTAFWGRTHEPRVSFAIDDHTNGRPSSADFYESVLRAMTDVPYAGNCW
jgi:hypothetical protein